MVDVGTSTTASFDTSGFTMSKVSVSLSTSRQIHEVPTLGATGFVDKLAGDLVNGGDCVIEGFLDPSETIPLGGADEVVTIVWPDTTSTVVTGPWSADERSAEVEQPMVQTITIAVKSITNYLT